MSTDFTSINFIVQLPDHGQSAGATNRERAFTNINLRKKAEGWKKKQMKQSVNYRGSTQHILSFVREETFVAVARRSSPRRVARTQKNPWCYAFVRGTCAGRCSLLPNKYVHCTTGLHYAGQLVHNKSILHNTWVPSYILIYDWLSFVRTKVRR